MTAAHSPSLSPSRARKLLLDAGRQRRTGSTRSGESTLLTAAEWLRHNKRRETRVSVTHIPLYTMVAGRPTKRASETGTLMLGPDPDANNAWHLIVKVGGLRVATRRMSRAELTAMSIADFASNAFQQHDLLPE